MGARRNDVSRGLRAAGAALLLGALLAAPAAAREAKRHAAPSHAAIAYHAPSRNIGWASERRTRRDAQLEALRQCGHPQCEVVTSLSGGCAALARNERRHSSQRGVNRAEAEAKALRRCGARCEIVAWVCTR
ncbi:MAG: DUF4189 domain-containing protein [Betaproteobacteria bacterium]|nr:MAG: DUF4189 domain-containing protein [Betaproteobacteria bacterium]